MDHLTHTRQYQSQTNKKHVQTVQKINIIKDRADTNHDNILCAGFNRDSLNLHILCRRCWSLPQKDLEYLAVRTLVRPRPECQLP